MCLKNVVFDLGAVLLEWDPEAIAKRFTSDCVQQNLLMKEIFQHPDWMKMDRGQLSEVDAIGRAAERTDLSELDLAGLFSIVKESLNIIPNTLLALEQAKKNGFDLYCLSNMSPENYLYVKQKYVFFDYFHGIVVSGMENTVKPEKEIYQILLQRFSLNPGETLFIDDREENTRTAADLGISTITFSASPECYSEISVYIKS